MKSHIVPLIALLISTPLIAGSDSKSTHQTWSYNGKLGPENWGDLHESFATCKTGKRQSPIDIRGKRHDMADTLILNYGKTPLNAYRRSEKVRQDIAPGHFATINGERYNLLQFHTHAPSEHMLNGKLYDGVMHFVHKNEKGDLLVVGVFLEVSSEVNSSWYRIINHMKDKKKGMLDLDALFTDASRYYHYDGSLTTPPCTENVKWIVMERPLKVSKEQMDYIRSQEMLTNRPVQARNGRKIYYTD